MKKIVTLGSATQDFFLRCEDVQNIHLHTKVDVQELHTAPGGGATNTAVAFKRLGFEVTAFFKIGDDLVGQQIIQELLREGIHIPTFSREHFGLMSTGTSYIIPKDAHEWQIFAHHGANAEFTLIDVELPDLQTIDCLFISPLTGPIAEKLPVIVDKAKDHQCFISVNPGMQQLINYAALQGALHSIDLLIMNSEEAHVFFKAFTGQQLARNWRLFFDMVLTRGPRIAIITDGARGVYVATESTVFYHPSLPIKPTNTVGAGDAFGATFTACILQGKSIEDAIIYGIINSTSCLVSKDAKAGLLNFASIEKRIHDIHRTELTVL